MAEKKPTMAQNSKKRHKIAIIHQNRSIVIDLQMLLLWTILCHFGVFLAITTNKLIFFPVVIFPLTHSVYGGLCLTSAVLVSLSTVFGVFIRSYR